MERILIRSVEKVCPPGKRRLWQVFFQRPDMPLIKLRGCGIRMRPHSPEQEASQAAVKRVRGQRQADTKLFVEASLTNGPSFRPHRLTSKMRRRSPLHPLGYLQEQAHILDFALLKGPVCVKLLEAEHTAH